MKAVCIKSPGMFFKFGRLYQYKITFTGGDIIRPMNEDMNIPISGAYIRPSFVTTSNKEMLVNGTISDEMAWELHNRTRCSANPKHESLVPYLKKISGLNIAMIRKNMDIYEAIVAFNEFEFEKYFIKFL